MAFELYIACCVISSKSDVRRSAQTEFQKIGSALNQLASIELKTVDMDPTECGQLYTPAMLAELLGVSVRMVRRWKRAGFIRPTTEVMQLPYFDYTELAAARQLANWIRQGASVQSIQSQIDALRRRAGADQPLQQLPITAEGKRLVLRKGDQFLEASGQLRFGFEAVGDGVASAPPATLQFQAAHARQRDKVPHDMQIAMTVDAMIDEAIAAEDDADFETAIEWYRAALAAHGPNADICFQIAELLYRTGDACGARERYYTALELNPELVEARANLGCVLAEGGQLELAIAAFKGTLEQFADYADVHFHLARALDDHGDNHQAFEHWRRFLELAPASPWAAEAQHRLSQDSPLFEF